MEANFGHEFGQVRVHTDEGAARSASAIGARAYTVGRDIAFASGEYAPASPGGRRLIAHELAHVVQQGNRTASRPLARSISSTADPLEEEAERAAQAVDDGRRADVRRRATQAGAVFRQANGQQGPTLGPLATLLELVETALAIFASCDHPAPLTWADFTGPPPAPSQFSAETRFRYDLASSGSRRIVQAIFQGSTSWVRPRFAQASVRAMNGCAPQVAACSQFLAGQAAAGLTGATYSLSPPVNITCAASVTPNSTLAATSVAECNTVLGAECDRVAVAESARLLRHEQGHYDLACVLARKGTRAILAGGAEAAILAAVGTKSGQQTTNYDTQTSHGCNAAEQARWETDIAAGLPAVAIP